MSRHGGNALHVFEVCAGRARAVLLLMHHAAAAAAALRAPSLSCSHGWYGMRLLLLLIMAAAVGLPLSFLALWSYVLVVLALLLAPFWCA